MSYTPYNHEKPNYFLLTLIVIISIASIYLLLLNNPKLVAQTPLIEGLAKYEKPEDITTFYSKTKKQENTNPHKVVLGQVHLNKSHSYIADKELSPSFIFPENWKVDALDRVKYELNNNYLFVSGLEDNIFLANNLTSLNPWKLSFSGRSQIAYIPPVFKNDFMYLLDQSKTLHFIQLSQKKIIWSRILTQDNIVHVYMDSNNQFYLFNTNGKELFVSKLSKLNGKLLWTKSLKKAERIYKMQDSNGSLYLYGDSNFYRIDTKSGAIKWSIESLSNLTSEILISKHQVFIATSEGLIYSVKISNGEKIWDYNAESPLNGNIAFIPIYNRITAMSDNGFIHTIDAITGERRWRLRLKVKPENTGLLAVKLNGAAIKNLVMDWSKKGWTIWGGCGLKSLCIFSPTSGQIMAKYYTSDKILSQPLFFKNNFALLIENKENENHPKLVLFSNSKN